MGVFFACCFIYAFIIIMENLLYLLIPIASSLKIRKKYITLRDIKKRLKSFKISKHDVRFSGNYRDYILTIWLKPATAICITTPLKAW